MGEVLEFLRRKTETNDCLVLPRHPTANMKLAGAYVLEPVSMDLAHHLYEMTLCAADLNACTDSQQRVVRVPSQMTPDMRKAATRVLRFSGERWWRKEALAEKVFAAMEAQRPL